MAGPQPTVAEPAPARVAEALSAALAPGDEAWLVGGALRDELLGLPVRDLDYVVKGAAEAAARRLADLLGGAFFVVSERFAAYRVIVGKRRVDVAPLRGATLEDDLRRRDFTFNALARPVRGAAAKGTVAPVGELLDPLGGASDLRERRLVLCSANALTDDPLRALRLVRFACRFALRPEGASLAAARRAMPGLADVSGERLQEELSELLALPAPESALRGLADLGGIAVILPELEALRGVQQNAYHHLDVFDHTLEALTFLPGVVDQLGGPLNLADARSLGLPDAAPLVPLGYAVLLHDIGKPAAKRSDEAGRIMFWRHDQIGSDMAADVARRLRMSRRCEAFLALLVRQHLRLGFLVRETPLTARALAHYRRDVEPYVFESVALSLADRLATRGERTSAASIARHFRLARDVWGEVAKESPSLPLGGAEVMALLGIEQGPRVGAALAALREEVEAGEVVSREQAEAFLQRWHEGGNDA